MRTLVDIPDEDIARLDKLAQNKNASRAAIIREAVSRHLNDNNDFSWLEAGFGAWNHRVDIGDTAEWQRRERASWTRPWDDDYEAVKAEFPGLLDEHDDRERAHYMKLITKRGGADALER